VIQALALEPAHLVADIGAGTGYFAVRLARALPSGMVFAVDIEPKMAGHIAKRAKAEKLSNIRTVVGDATSPKLPQPVDRVLLINTYHHIDARPGYFRALRPSLKPGARVAIVDYRVDAPRGAPKHMRLPPEKIAAEMAEAGYRLVESFDFLPLQTYQVFAADKP
jgi:precorrin-6B methylase 2